MIRLVRRRESTRLDIVEEPFERSDCVVGQICVWPHELGEVVPSAESEHVVDDKHLPVTTGPGPDSDGWNWYLRGDDVSHSAGHTLQETLVSAQAMSEDLKKTAMKEAELMISEAEVKGEKILDAAHRRAAKLAEDIRELKQLRSRLGAALRATIDTHIALLDSFTEDSPDQDPVLEGKVAFLSHRSQGGAGSES